VETAGRTCINSFNLVSSKKKALDYVSDYQLKSVCKDATRIAPSKITQMIFAVLEDWYHHIVLTHSCKLVSFFTYITVTWQRNTDSRSANSECFQWKC